jgi:hypothetical protein
MRIVLACTALLMAAQAVTCQVAAEPLLAVRCEQAKKKQDAGDKLTLKEMRALVECSGRPVVLISNGVPISGFSN